MLNRYTVLNKLAAVNLFDMRYPHTMSRARAAITAVLALGVVLTWTAALGQSTAVYKKFKGQMVVATEEIPVLDDDAAMVKHLKKVAKSVLQNDGGTWSFHFMAFLTR